MLRLSANFFQLSILIYYDPHTDQKPKNELLPCKVLLNTRHGTDVSEVDLAEVRLLQPRYFYPPLPSHEKHGNFVKFGEKIKTIKKTEDISSSHTLSTIF